MLLAANAAKDLSIVLDRPWDPSILWMGTYLKSMALTQTVMSEDIPYMPLGAISLVSNMPKLQSIGDRDLFTDRFNACLRAVVGEELSKGRGSKLDPSFCLSEESVLLFDGFAYYGQPQRKTVREIDISTCRPWQDLFKGLACYVSSTVSPSWKKEEWEALTLLDSDQYHTAASVVAGTYVSTDEIEAERDRNGEAQAEEDEEEPVGEEEIESAPWWVPDIRAQDPSSSTLDGGEEYPMTGRILVDYDVLWRQPAPKRLLKALDSIVLERPEEATAFIPSDMWYMDAAKMSPRQKRFYIQWRYEVANGIYSDSDFGYLKLLITDAVATVYDQARCLELLTGLYHAYSAQNHAIKTLIGSACTDYAILTGQDPPLSATGQERDFVLSQKLKAVPLGRIPMSMMHKFKGVDTEKYVHPGYDYDTALNRIVESLDRECRKTRSQSLYDHCKGKEIVVEREMIPRIIHTWPKYVQFKMSPVSDNRLGSLLAAAAKVAIIAVNETFGLSCPRLPKNVEQEELDLMLKAARSAMSGVRSERESAERSKRMASITIDTNAVADAESALETVKKLMTVEGASDDEEEPQKAEAVVEPQQDLTGWPALASALDEEQKGYLSACLDGKGAAFLKKINKKQAKMEDSVNALSMDLVGDQVVESGEVFEDYAEDVRGIL